MTIDAISTVMAANINEFPISLSEKRKASIREDGLVGKNTSFLDTVEEVSKVGKVETPYGTGDGSSDDGESGTDYRDAIPVRNMATAHITSGISTSRLRFTHAAAYEPSDSPYLRSLALSMYKGTFSYSN